MTGEVRKPFNYLDPGTGVAVAGSVWNIVVAFFAAVVAWIVKYFWKPIKKAFRKAVNAVTPGN